MSPSVLKTFQGLSHYEQYSEVIKLLNTIESDKQSESISLLRPMIMSLTDMLKDMGCRDISSDNMLGLYASLINIIDNCSISDFESMFGKIKYIWLKIKKPGKVIKIDSRKQ